MGGRQAHGRPLLATGSSKKRGNNREKIGREEKSGRVDVLALAAKQIGKANSKGVRHQHLAIERDINNRRRGIDEDDDKEDGCGDAPKRWRRDMTGGEEVDSNQDEANVSDEEVRSDSDGNEWHVGMGSDDDDSEIDSDEAFGESDVDMSDRYAFRGRRSAASNKDSYDKSPGFSKDEFEAIDIGIDEEDEDVRNDSQALDEEAIDLAQVLDLTSVSKENVTGKIGQKNKRNSEMSFSEDKSFSAEDVSPNSGSGDEGNGDLSSSSASNFGSESDSSLDEGEDSDFHAEYKFDALQSIASAFAGQGQNNSAGPVESAHLKISLEDLGLDDIKDAPIEKSLKLFAMEGKSDRQHKKLDIPLARNQRDQLNRVAAAEKAHETLDRWIDTVKQNRRAEHLTFQVAGSLQDTGLESVELQPINHRSAKTELERTILSIMEESGLGPTAQGEETQDSSAGRVVKTKPISPEELKQLVSQQRRQREFQSREQARAKRIKKIKSKAYRRVHRREKARQEAALAELEEGEEVDSDVEREAQHRRRAMERMGSRHRESKWAKKAKNTGREAWDDDFRVGLVDMARRDNELRRRVDRRGDGEVAGGDYDSDSESDKDEDEEDLCRSMMRELEEAGPVNDDKEPESALMDIPFMKKAELARKKANEEAVAELIRDLDHGRVSEEAENVEEDGGKWVTVGRRTYGIVATKNENKRATISNKRWKVAGGTSEGGAQGKLRLLEDEEQRRASWGVAMGIYKEDTIAGDSMPGGKVGSWSKTARFFIKGEGRKAGVMREQMEGDNLQVTEALARLASVGQDKARKAQPKPKPPVADSDTSSSRGDRSSEDEDRKDGNVSNSGRRYVSSLNLKDTNLLIKALDDDDAAAEFAREKARMAAEEVELAGGYSKNPVFLPGWGSWAGEGISNRSIRQGQKRLRQCDKDTVHPDKKKVVRKDSKIDRVMISERRIHKNEMYLASQLPHDYETKNQYERSLRLPIGPEWGTKLAFQDATKPRVSVKQGVIMPMANRFL